MDIKPLIQRIIDDAITKEHIINNLEDKIFFWFTQADLKSTLEYEFLNTHSQLYRLTKDSFKTDRMLYATNDIIKNRADDLILARKEILPAFMKQLKGVINPEEGLFWSEEYSTDTTNKVQSILPCINPYQIRGSDGLYRLYMTNGNGACSSLRSIFNEYGDDPDSDKIKTLTGVSKIVLKRTKNANGYRYSVSASSVKNITEFAKYLLKGSAFKGAKCSKLQQERLLGMLESSKAIKLDYITDLLSDYLKLVIIKD